jgi:hypothetical protein
MYIEYLKSVKEPKIRTEATRRILQVRPKIQKKIIETPNQLIRTQIFSEIRMGDTGRNLPRKP